MDKAQIARRRFSISLAFACFVAQGVNNGMLGVAWPSIRDTFNQPIDAIGLLFVALTVGYVIGGVTASQLMARLSIGRSLLLSNLFAALGMLGYALSPSWPFMALTGLLVGWTGGVIVASLNIFIAATRTVRIMNWMHASYGVGATIGPLVMTAVIGTTLGWRAGYLIAALIYAVIGLLFLSVLPQMGFRSMGAGQPGADGESARPAGTLATLRVPLVLLGVLALLFYTGIEATTGQWAFSLFTEARGISTYLGGILTSLYWAMLTFGRIIFGAAADRIGITRLLRLSMVGTVLAACLFLIREPLFSYPAVALMGLSLSAIFPTLMSDTPNRVGYEHASTAISYQTSSASIGQAALPGLAGILAARYGLEILGPYLVAGALMMFFIHEAVVRMEKRKRPLAGLGPAG